jgi:hypothetical protein
MADPTFAPPANRLVGSGIPNTPRPAAGFGLVANEKGQITPPTVHLDSYAGAASGSLTLTTTFQDVAGASVTLVNPGTYFVAASFDFNHTGAGAGDASGRLSVDGTAQAGTITLSEGAVRANVGQNWIVTTTARDVVAKLQAAKTINAGTAVAQATHTTLIAFRIA